MAYALLFLVEMELDLDPGQGPDRVSLHFYMTSL
jgi:hypothetical protein